MRKEIASIVAVSLLLFSCASCASTDDGDVASMTGGFVREDDSAGQAAPDADSDAAQSASDEGGGFPRTEGR